MAKNIIEGWRKFRYLAPASAWPMMDNLKRPEDMRYRLRLPSNLSSVIRAPLYDYRYVQEFVQIIGFINAVIASSNDPFLSSSLEPGLTYLENICSCMDKCLHLEFDYDELSKELWDDQLPDLLSDPTLWEAYKGAKTDVIRNFRRMIDSYKLWSTAHTELNFQRLVTAFHDFLEVK
jgi:hypothetical protein